MESLDANEDDRNAIETGPKKLQGGSFLVENFDSIQSKFPSTAPSSIKTEEDIYLADEPRWVPYEQALKALKDSDLSTISGLESNICYPPRVSQPHVAGTFIKIAPVKKKIECNIRAPEVQENQGDDDAVSAASADELRFDISMDIDVQRILDSLE